MRLIQEINIERDLVAKILHCLALKAAMGEIEYTARKYIFVKYITEQCSAVMYRTVKYSFVQ